MAGLTTSGLGSGLDINSMVGKLVAAERSPTDTRLARQEADAQAKISAIGTVKSAFSDLRTSLASLRDAKALDKVNASSSDSSTVSASADATAKAGSYSLVVSQLAQAQIQSSQGFAADNTAVLPVLPGTLTLQVGTSSKSISVDAGNNTLSGIRDAINAAGAGVTASIVNDGSSNGYHLMLKSDNTGTSNAVTLTDSSGTLAFTEKQAAQDAQVKINGLDITSASNSISSAVSGVTFNLAQAQAGKTVNISVSQDTGGFSSAVKSLVDKYNAVVDAVAQVSSYDAANKQAGPLLSDSSIRSAVQRVRNLMGEAVSGLSGSVTRPQDIGITTQRDGKLAFDTTKFNKAVSADKSGAISLFASDTGLSNKLDKALGGILDKGGILDARSSGIQKTIAGIGKERDALNTRMAAYQDRLLKQYNSMDSLVARLNSTGAAFSQQMSALTNSSSK